MRRESSVSSRLLLMYTLLSPGDSPTYLKGQCTSNAGIKVIEKKSSSFPRSSEILILLTERSSFFLVVFQRSSGNSSMSKSANEEALGLGIALDVDSATESPSMAVLDLTDESAIPISSDHRLACSPHSGNLQLFSRICLSKWSTIGSGGMAVTGCDMVTYLAA